VMKFSHVQRTLSVFDETENRSLANACLFCGNDHYIKQLHDLYTELPAEGYGTFLLLKLCPYIILERLRIPNARREIGLSLDSTQEGVRDILAQIQQLLTIVK
jgi:hypothetical protein